MDRRTYKVRGQAIVEFTIVSVTLTLLVSAAIALTATLRKELKHSFVKTNLEGTASELPSTIDALKPYVKFFPRQNRKDTLIGLRESGWQEDRRLKIPEGLIILLKNSTQSMGLIQTRRDQVGVYYR